MSWQVDNSIYFWPRTVAESARALVCGVKWILRTTRRIMVRGVADPAGREMEINRLGRKLRELEREHRSVMILAERAIAQRDRYYDLYLQTLSARSAA
jgi:hypothetical protein